MKKKTGRSTRMTGGTVALVKGMEFSAPRRKELKDNRYVMQFFLDGDGVYDCLKTIDSNDNESVVIESRAELKRLIAWMVEVEKSWHLGGVSSF